MPLTSGSSGEPAECGNGELEQGEECDGTPGEQTCDGLGEPGGGLECDEDCEWDTSECACGSEQEPIGGDCPDECNGGCSDTGCLIECDGEEACQDDTITCPPGWRCRVQCTGQEACERADISCSNQACRVECNGQQACNDAVINCGAGPCTLDCGPGQFVCNDTVFNCGPNDSSVNCDVPWPSLDVNDFPGSSCACESQGC